MARRVGAVGTAAPLLLVALALAGCGGGGGKKGIGGRVPDCVAAVRHKELSSRFPGEFPLPEGTVVGSEYLDRGARVAELFIRGDLDSAREYYREQLPKRGFDLGEGEAEEEEAETEFDGHGFEGRLKLHTIRGCDEALSLAVVLRPRS
jgi:hypothetical protein